MLIKLQNNAIKASFSLIFPSSFFMLISIFLGLFLSISHAQEDLQQDELKKKCNQTRGVDRYLFEMSEDQKQWVSLKQLPIALENKEINRVDFYCDLEECNERKIGQLVQLMGLSFQSFTQSLLLRAWQRMMQSGMFDNSSFFSITEDQNQKINLLFCSRAYVTIQEIKFIYEGFRSRFYPKQFTTELQKRLKLRKGGPLPSDPKKLKEQEDKLESLYDRLGYKNTKIRLKPEYDLNQPRLARLFVEIKEGERPILGYPLVRGNEKLSYWKIAQALNPDTFFDFAYDFFEIFGIGRFDKLLFREKVLELEQKYREEGFFSAKVRHIGMVEEEQILYPMIEIEEGNRVSIRFEGNEHISALELKEALTFKESGSIDEVERQQSKLGILKKLQALGFYYAEVNDELIKIYDNDVQLSYFIDEGPQVYVGDIHFIGNQFISTATLNDLMSTKGIAPDGVMYTLNSTSGILQDDQINQDLNQIAEYYKDNGFFNMNFRCIDRSREDLERWLQRKKQLIEEEGEFDIWSTDTMNHLCFQTLNDKSNRDKRHFLKLKIEINEGHQTTLDEVDLSQYLGSMKAKLQDEAYDLLRALGFWDRNNKPIKGAGVSSRKIELLRGFLIRYFQQNGYLRATVKAVCELYSGEKKGCSMAELYHQKIKRLSFDVTLGVRSDVIGILFRGNLKTSEELLRNELLLKPYQPLNTEALFLSQSNLRSLGTFRMVNIETIGLNEAPVNALQEPITLVVSVEENPNWQLDALLGLQLKSNTLVNTKVNQLNLLYTSGLNVRRRNLAGKAWEFGAGINHSNLLTNPLAINDDNASWTVGPFFKNPRLWGTKVILTSDLNFEQGLTAQRDAYRQQGRLSLLFNYDFYQLSYPSEWGRGLRLDLTIESKLERRRILTQSTEQRQYDDRLLSSVSVIPKIIWDQRDNPIHPTRGIFLSVSLENLFNTITSQASILSFKETITAQWIKAFLKKQLIFAPLLRFGAVQTDEAYHNLTSDFLFKAGGDGAYGVRGYIDASIEACKGKTVHQDCQIANENAQNQIIKENNSESSNQAITVGGKNLVNLNLELRFPMISNFWGAIFNDWGAVTMDLKEMTWQQFYPSLGFGLRWLVTGQIPIRFDIAYPLKETVFGPQEPRFHFNIFYTL